jgi:hypothetical protein
MEAISSVDTLSTRRYIPQDDNIHNYRCEGSHLSVKLTGACRREDQCTCTPSHSAAAAAVALGVYEGHMDIHTRHETVVADMGHYACSRV